MPSKSQKEYKVTVLGGGIGSFTILSGLKNYPDLLSQKIPHKVAGDKLSRALVRHDPYKTAHALYQLLQK